MKRTLAIVLAAGIALTGCQPRADGTDPSATQNTQETQSVQDPQGQTEPPAAAELPEVTYHRGDIVDRNGNLLAGTKDDKRFYPNASLAGDVIGYTDKDGRQGIGGIEETYQERLQPNVADGVLISGGNSVVSTIDAKIQGIVESHIFEWQQSIGADHIGVVVMDPGNGEILAMANEQKFNLNDVRESLGPIRNFCISETYEPGATAQVFTVAAALEEGVLTGDESFLCDGGQEVGGHKIFCISRAGHGKLTIEEALAHSCNDSMMQIAELTGAETFAKYQKRFGFGTATGIDLPDEADTGTLVYSADNMDAAVLATNSFGQNYNTTMIQTAAAYSALVNGGTYYQPHVVKEILDEQGAILATIEPETVQGLVSEETSNFIKEALYQAVENGTGKSAAVEGYEIAGKTGVAEKLPRGEGNYLVSFCGFAPADHPQILVYVVIDTPYTEDQAHSSFAGELSRKILSDVLPYPEKE